MLMNKILKCCTQILNSFLLLFYTYTIYLRLWEPMDYVIFSSSILDICVLTRLNYLGHSNYILNHFYFFAIIFLIFSSHFWVTSLCCSSHDVTIIHSTHSTDKKSDRQWWMLSGGNGGTIAPEPDRTNRTDIYSFPPC